MIKKLLAATSVAALIVGGANAQLALVQTDANGGDISAPYVLAEEVDFALLNATGNTDGIGQFGLAVLTEGVIPPGQNIFLTIQVTNGTIAGNLNGSEFADAAGLADGGVTGAVVNSGGVVGATSVRYLITTDIGDGSIAAFAGKDGVALTLPIRATGCGDVTFSVTEFATESGATPIEGGTASLTDGLTPPKVIPAVTCKSAFAASLVPFAGGTLDQDADPIFSTFDSAATVDQLGTFNLALAATPIYRNLQGDAADYTDVTGFKADIDLESTAGILSGTAVPAVGALFDATALVSGNDINLVGTVDATGAVPVTGRFDLNLKTGTSAASVSSQKVGVSDAVITLDTTLGYKETDAFVASDVSDLVYEGTTFGPFDWVSDSTKAVNSIFRVTGLPTDQDIPLQIIVENARNGSAFNGVYSTTILGSSVQGSEVRLNSAQLEAIAGKFGTADISMVFSAEDSVNELDLDVDRLNASPSSSVVTPFGDNSNSDSSADSLSSTAIGVNDDNGNY